MPLPEIRTFPILHQSQAGGRSHLTSLKKKTKDFLEYMETSKQRLFHFLEGPHEETREEITAHLESVVDDLANLAMNLGVPPEEQFEILAMVMSVKTQFHQRNFTASDRTSHPGHDDVRP